MRKPPKGGRRGRLLAMKNSVNRDSAWRNGRNRSAQQISLAWGSNRIVGFAGE